MLLPLMAMTVSGGSKKENVREKARYFYLLGAVSEAQERTDEAYEYYRKAYQTDPTYRDAAFAYGYNRIIDTEETPGATAEIARNLSYMRALVDAYPRDIDAALTYAYYAAVADTVEEAVRVFDILVSEFPGKSHLYYPQAFMLMQTGDSQHAVDALREYERLEGTSSETTLRKVSFLLADGDTIAALQEVKRYAAENPGKPEPMMDKAMVYNALGQRDSAILFMEDALGQFPDNTDIMINLALLQVEAGDTVSFHRLIASALEDEEMEEDEKMDVLNLYLRNIPAKRNGEFYAPSDSVFSRIAKEYPSNTDFLDIYASYLLLKSDYPEAYAILRKALELEPDNDFLLAKTIGISVLAKKPLDGMQIYENSQDERVKKEYKVLVAYISAAKEAKEFEKAIAGADTLLQGYIPELSIATGIDSTKLETLAEEYADYVLANASIAFELAGDIYLAAEDYEKTTKAYDNSLLLSADNVLLLNNYAYFLVDKLKVDPGSPEFARAKEMSYRSLELTQDNPQSTYYDTYAWILFREQNYKEALDYQELAMEAEGDSAGAEMFSHYGDILFMNGRPDDALVQWEKALQLEPDDITLKKKVEHKTFFYE